ncbi:MAG: ABC transporter permease [Pseudobutyrivibrio sp.]|nr:ABC transporter permease [Pseudobutyrivibrio sp.]
MGKRVNVIEQYIFAIRQINYKEYKNQTNEMNLGWLWDYLNPLIYMIIMSTYYQNIIVKKIENFPVFVFIGITIFNYYQSATNGAMRSIVSNKQLLIKSQMPVEIYIYQKIIMAARTMFFSFVMLIPIIMFFKIRLTWRVVQIIPIFLLTTIIIIGISKILAVLYVYFEDIGYLYSVFMTLMVFVSCVFVPLEKVPDNIRTLFQYNPIYISISMVRDCLMYGTVSHISYWVKITSWAVLLLLVGNKFFKVNKNKFVNLI